MLLNRYIKISTVYQHFSMTKHTRCKHC